MSIYKKIIVAAGLLLPMSLLAQNSEKEDTLQGGFLQTVVISYYNNNADFYGRRYDGQARTERLLDNIPGINLISRGNFAQEPVLHGMSDGQINVTINSMHLFGACTDRMDPITSYIEPNNMKSLQVCSGSCFSSCGAAIGGGLNFDLRQAQDNASKKWSGSAGTGFETNAAARQFLGNIQYSSKRFAFSLDGIYRKAGDYSPGGNKNENIEKYDEWTKENGFTVDDKGRINFSQYEKWNAHANALYQLNTHQTLSADYLQDEASNVGYPALIMDVAYARSKTGSITHEYHNANKVLYYWQTKIYYNDINHAMDNSKRPMEELPMQMMEMNMTGHSQTDGAYTQLYWKASSSHLIKAKLESYYNRWHADMMMMAMDSSNSSMNMLTIPDAERSVVGLDVTDEIRLTNAWYVTPGIHTEYNRSSIFSSGGKDMLASVYSGNPDKTHWLYNAFAELDYRPASPFGFGLKLARAMRAPTLKEMYAFYLYNRVDGYDYIGNPGIKKESSFNSEVSFSYRQKNFEAVIKGFGYLFQNYIAAFVQSGDSSMTPGAIGVKQSGNIHSAYIAGASLLFNWKLSQKILFNSNNTWQQGADKNDNYLPMIMPFKSVNTLRYSISSWRFFVEGIGAAAQNKTSTFYGETRTPGFFIADGGADKSINLHGSQVILSLTCNNIFNRYYYENLDVIKLPREGRNFIVHATYNF
ncbi:MAG TPA: TonB-dependent receptor plug domain-containing protein [Hanamia sp.]|nr:TonB-dependent receptor plug domain-containing protein [Hanamia sp.]